MSNTNTSTTENETETIESQAEAATEAVAEAANDASNEAAEAVSEAAAEVAEATTEVASEAAETVEAAAEAAEEVSGAAAEAAEGVVETVEEAAAETVEAASEATEAAAEAVEEVVSETAEAAAETVEAAAEATEAAAEATEAAAEVVEEAADETVEVAAETTESAAEALEAATAKTVAEVAKALAAVTADMKASAEAEARRGEGEDSEPEAAVPGFNKLQASADDEPGETMAMLEKAQKEKIPVEGQVIGWNKGGYHVAIGKVAAFCPVSQIEVGNPRRPVRYLDKTFDFLVIEIQEGGRRVVVSRSEALKAAKEARAALVREWLKPGSKIDGKITSITDFGAFVDLGGGIEGLVHISELSRRRVDHPKELVKVGDPAQVVVLKIEKGGERISLSMKRLEKDPWKGIASRLPAGSEFEGKVLRKADFGMFVEVEPGIEGLVHVSRLPLGTTLESEELAVGNTIKGWVHDVDGRRRRLSLSLREVASENPWRGVGERFPVGEVVKGTVERLAKFGVFIELEPGLTGLLPFSTLPGGGRTGNPRRQFHPGKEVSVRVLAIDSDKKRISLGTESSKAEGNMQDYKEYVKSQRSSSGGSGMSAMAAAFAKLREQQDQQDQQ